MTAIVLRHPGQVPESSLANEVKQESLRLGLSCTHDAAMFVIT